MALSVLQRMAIVSGLGLALIAAAPPATDPAILAWAFPAAVEPSPPVSNDAVTPRSIPGSGRRFTEAQIHDLTRAVDWFPARHAPLPAAVAGGAGGGIAACGFCHLPGGEGRVENASLAGLMPDYIARQVAAFAAGTRTAVVPSWGPSSRMRQVAHQVSAADVAAAAAYFGRIHFTSSVRVVEAAAIPAMRPRGFIFAHAAGTTEPLGDRIVETPDDLPAFDRRDPRVTYTAYVPPGSLARGAAVTQRVGCPACHGAGVRQWGAGRSPTYIFRQLLAFQTGARHDPEAPPMTTVAAQLSSADMIAVAAYWGSLRP